MPKRVDAATNAGELVALETITVPIEIAPTDAAKLRKAIVRLVEQKVAEAMGGDDSICQPWFQSRDVTKEIRKLQTVAEREKWTHYFDEWGCLICETRNSPHDGLGMCGACRGRTLSRLSQILKQHAPRPGQFEATFTDEAPLARKALAPSTAILRANKRGRR